MKILVYKTIDVLFSVTGDEEQHRKYVAEVKKDLDVEHIYTDYVAMDFDPIWNHYIEIAATTSRSVDFIRNLIYRYSLSYEGDMDLYVKELVGHFNVNIIPAPSFEYGYIIEMSEQEFERLELIQKLLV